MAIFIKLLLYTSHVFYFILYKNKTHFQLEMYLYIKSNRVFRRKIVILFGFSLGCFQSSSFCTFLIISYFLLSELLSIALLIYDLIGTISQFIFQV